MFSLYIQITGKRTVKEAIKEFEPKVKTHLEETFAKAGLSFPPQSVTMLFFKKEKKMELWAKNKDQNNGPNDGKWILVSSYKIRAASGKSGPKLKEGDRQVPEGIYRITGLNPNSRFHVSMKLNYPNEFDQLHGRQDGRENLGGDIFIHGKAASIGCLAMGDQVIEQLFYLVYRVGLKNVAVIIMPYNFLKHAISFEADVSPRWLPDLYKKINAKLQPFRSETSPH